MSYELYRNTTLGNSLQESLDELIQVKTYHINKNLKIAWNKNETERRDKQC